ncbi:MAG: cation transporter [Actinomycetota bacterium]|nr:cation transporter [Actinomycetota bacterium]
MSVEAGAGDHYNPVLKAEQRSLGLSLAAACILAVVGVAWGLSVSSQIILFDGAYGVIGVALSALTLHASNLVRRGPSSRYPFGREALGPLVLGVQGLVLLGAFGYAVIDAIQIILAGGGQTELGAALVYAVIAFAGSAAVYLVLRRTGRHSELVAAEAAQWAAAVLLGLAMLIGFSTALLLEDSQWAWFAGYVDPILVLVAAAIIAPTPIGMLRTTIRELLEGAPGDEVEAPIHQAIAAVNHQLGLPAPESVLIGKLGRKVYVEVDYLVESDRWTLADGDHIRRELSGRLHSPGLSFWLNVELHTDPDWDSQ